MVEWIYGDIWGDAGKTFLSRFVASISTSVSSVKLCMAAK